MRAVRYFLGLAFVLLLTLPLASTVRAQAGPATGAAQQAPAGNSMPGMDMGGAPAPVWSHWQLWALLAVGVLFFILWALRRATHLPVSMGVIEGVAILLAVFFLVSYLVARYKQPGQTTLLEANTMDMSAMKPPTGAVPVATEVVAPRSFSAAVTYTGTVVPLNSQDVFPRVPGTIVSLPVYNGDHVRPGQLLVRLDDQEYSAQEQAAAAERQMRVQAEGTSQREVEAAAAGQQSAQADVARMQAEAQVSRRQITAAEASITESQGAVRQAGHDQEAAQQEQAAAEQAREGALSDVEVAQADIPVAEAETTSAQADLDYWQAEIKREKQLLDQGVVSTDEYQKEEDQYKGAQAKLAQAQIMVRQKRSALRGAQAKVAAAEAEIRKARAMAASAEAMVAQAQARAQKAVADRDTAQAQLSASLAAVRSGQAGVAEKAAMVRASVARVGEAAAGVSQSTAQLTAARTVRGYTEIRATQPGRVTARVTSPGVLVQPGNLILRIAQLDRVRLQAYVSERDAAWLRVGFPVEAAGPKLSEPLQARITSISPGADPTTRTAVVEAIVNNPGEKLAAGDAVTLKLMSPPRPGVLTAPSSAIVYRPVTTGAAGAQEATVWLITESSGTGKTTYTCTMHPEIHAEKPGSCPKCGMTLVPETSGATGGKRAHQVVVKLGATSGERTEVTDGLCAGNEVITRGQTDLREGDLISPVPWGPQGPITLPAAPGAAPAAPSGAGTTPPAASQPSGGGAMPPGMKMSAPLTMGGRSGVSPDGLIAMTGETPVLPGRRLGSWWR